MKLLVPLRNLESALAHGTEATYGAMVQLLNYFATHRDAFIWYKQSNMIIAINSDASYMSEKKECIQTGSHFFLNNKLKGGQPMMNNRAVYVVSTIIRNVI